MQRIHIIGAGPAGLTMALAFAQQGYRPIVHETHLWNEPVGAGVLLHPLSLSALATLHVNTRNLGIPIRTLSCKSQGLMRNLPLVNLHYGVEDDPSTWARSVSRHDLCERLMWACERHGVELNHGQMFQAEHAQEYLGEPTIIACGWRNVKTVLSWMNIEEHQHPQIQQYPWGSLNTMATIPLADWNMPDNILQQRVRGCKTMAGWMLSKKDASQAHVSLFWSASPDLLEKLGQGQGQDWMHHFAKTAPHIKHIMDSTIRTQWRAARYADVRIENYHIGGTLIALCGEACHGMSPQLGLGTTLAAFDALRMRYALERNKDNLRAALVEYGAQRPKEVWAAQVLSKALTPWFQSYRPGLIRDAVFAIGNIMPGGQMLAHSMLKKGTFTY